MAGSTVVVGNPSPEAAIRALGKQVNNIITDLATIRGAGSDSVVAVTELITDHATFKTAVDQIETLVEELHDDHATNKTIIDELKTDYTALLADVTAIRNAVLAITAKLDADGGVTDTNYASTTNPAALTATAIAASSAATLTAPKPASAPATLSASAPSATAVDEAGDLIAAAVTLVGE